MSDGREVVIQPEEETDEATIRLLFLDMILMSLFHQRRMLPVHGSCIQTPQGAIIFGGVSGAGKSTFAAIFEQKGYPVLADDVTVIQFADDSTPMVLPSYPSLKLWPDVLEMLGYSDYKMFRQVRPNISKYYLPLEESFYTQPAKLKTIYVIDLVEMGQTTLKTMSQVRKVPALNGLIRSFHMALEMDILRDYWVMVNHLVQAVNMKTLARTRTDTDINRMVQYFLEDGV